MSAPARLLGLRVQGFKSFAERTLVEFGPGISAVVGPNGSGKSNLADALRWALGEQGRSLRIRKSEDVIWAGSEKRSAQGMADVTLVIDNADGLLPVEYSVLELGRRLYRSGENDYLLNKQRVRLRDLQDLLDAANLADNAFLFIGQGMVDQALALRPEERRPLFEEVAGVRRHERRRRKAEEQLAEAEGNLARVEDILAELRPQARRLGQLAEQQATRLTAGEELAAALIAAAHGRWHEAAGAGGRSRRGAGTRCAQETAGSLEALEIAESSVGDIAASMAARAETEREGREIHEAARAALGALGLREARAAGEIQAARPRPRPDRRASAPRPRRTSRPTGGSSPSPIPERDLELEAALGDADRALAEALAELGSLRAASRARGDELAALRRAEAARAAEAETARRRQRGERTTRPWTSVPARRRVGRATGPARGAAGRRARGARGRRRVRGRGGATHARRRGRPADAAEGTRRAVRGARRTSRLAGRGRPRPPRGGSRRGSRTRRTAGSRGPRAGSVASASTRSSVIEPSLRAAVEAALGELARAYVRGRGGAASLAGERGHVVVRERIVAAGPRAGWRQRGGPAAGSTTRSVRASAAAGSRMPFAGIRTAPCGRCSRVPSGCRTSPQRSTLQPVLPLGWVAVTRDGIGGRRRLHGPGRTRRRAARAARGGGQARARGRGAPGRGGRGRGRDAAARRARRGRRERRSTRREPAESAAASAPAARRGRRSAQPGASSRPRRARPHGTRPRPSGSRPRRHGRRPRSRRCDGGDAREVHAAGGGAGRPSWRRSRAWERAGAELRARRDRLADDVAAQEGGRRDAEATPGACRGRRVARRGPDRRRPTADLAALAERERAAGDERNEVAGELAAATARETAARAALESLLADDRAERARLAEAERAATAARERLRAADDRARRADVAAMEARLELDVAARAAARRARRPRRGRPAAPHERRGIDAGELGPAAGGDDGRRAERRARR